MSNKDDFNGANLIKKPILFKNIPDSVLVNEPQLNKGDYVIQGEEGFKKGFVEVTIPNRAFLGEYIDKLPFGVINKTETGIGGTTLELNSPRHSIIVEPTRAIAATKAKGDILYVGSNYGSFKNNYKFNDWLNVIKLYASGETPTYKKIVVVADSLPKVVEALGEEIKEYFLLIDEIDIFQEGTFRPNLERCIDYYFTHPKEKRALISATIKEFSNPNIVAEPLNIFKYPKPVSRDIHTIRTNNIGLAVGKKILEIFEKIKNTNYKLIIAYDVIENTLAIIEYLIENGISKESIGILCGNSSSDLVKDFYLELNEDEAVRAITFKTSAYFSGIDFKFKYHLLCVSNQNIKHSSLSTDKIQQIAGRCRIRDGILSFTIIFNVKKIVNVFIWGDAEYYIASAEKQVDALRCFKTHVYTSLSSYNQFVEMQNDILTAINKQDLGFTRTDFNNEPAISYFKIDKFLEDIDVETSQYLTPQGLNRKLRKYGNNVIESEMMFDEVETISQSKILQNNKAEQISSAIKLLKEFENHECLNIDDLIKQSQNLKYSQKVFNQYKSLMGIVEHNDLVMKIEEFALKRDNREFQIYSNRIKEFKNTRRLKKDILENFKVAKVYSSSTIGLEINRLMALNNFQQLDPASAVKYLGIFFDLKRTTFNHYRIISLYNPDVRLIF